MLDNNYATSVLPGLFNPPTLVNDVEKKSSVNTLNYSDPKKFSKTVCLRLPKFSKRISREEFSPFLQTYVGDNVKTFGCLQAPNEWQLEVTSKEIRESLLNLHRTRISGRSCLILPLHPGEVIGYIHWLPADVSDTILVNFLRRFGEVSHFSLQTDRMWTRKNSKEMPARRFILFLKSYLSKDVLPHFFKVGRMTGLITIKGRDPACFRCKTVGHRKTQCKAPRRYPEKPEKSVKRKSEEAVKNKSSKKKSKGKKSKSINAKRKKAKRKKSKSKESKSEESTAAVHESILAGVATSVQAQVCDKPQVPVGESKVAKEKLDEKEKLKKMQDDLMQKLALINSQLEKMEQDESSQENTSDEVLLSAMINQVAISEDKVHP